MSIAEKLTTIAENVPKVYESGKKSQYDEFWDAFQRNGTRTNYTYAFQYWGQDYIRPKYKIVPTIRCLHQLFQYNPNLKKVESAFFDFSQMEAAVSTNTGAYNTFAYCEGLEEVEDIGFPPYYYSETFYKCSKLHTIACINSNDNTVYSQYVFWQCISLVNLTVNGTIGQNNFNLQWSTKLSKESITSVVNALSENKSGLSVMLSKAAVNNAFTTSEWDALEKTKTNWTISLV
jgi:hypothetical protein